MKPYLITEWKMLTNRKSKWAMVEIVFLLIAVLIVLAGCDGASGGDDATGGDDTADEEVPAGGCGGATDGGGGIDVDTGDNSCLNRITSYAPGRGPFSVRRATSGMVKMWVPNVPAGCKVPVVHLANGTGGMCAGYGSILSNLAAYGFLAVCYENMNTGQGTQAITAIETAIRQHSRIADPNKLGFTGHSQGGGGAIMGVYRAEQKWGMRKTYSGLAMQPASGFGNSPMNWSSLYGQIQSPVSMFNGTADMLVAPSYVRMAYNALRKAEFRVWYTATGAGSTHVPIPTGPTREMSVPWFRWTLLGDTNACRAFKALPNGAGWRVAASSGMPDCR